MKVDIGVFGSRNVLRAMEVSKDGWNKLGWDMTGAPPKIAEHS